MPEVQETPASADYYRGMVTDRGLTRELNRKDGEFAVGSLDLLGLTLADLENHRTLDVGVGGGRSLRQAQELGFDYQGADLLPLIDAEQLTNELYRFNVKAMQARLAAVVARYPDRFKVADFAGAELPYPPNSFDLVISAGALPDYAQDGREVVQALLNMIKVSRNQVVCPGGWFADNPKGIVRLGRSDKVFSFAMKDFLEALADYGIAYRLRPEIVSEKLKGTKRMMNLDLDVSQKDSAKLLAAEADLLARAHEFQATDQP
jgi:SAM-dependent methyltransferase